MINPVSNVQINLSPKFNSQLIKAPTEIKIAFDESLELFKEDPLKPHPNLRSHSLREKYTGFSSIDVTEDWRALFKIRQTKLKTVITFHILGTHTQLYEQNMF